MKTKPSILVCPLDWGLGHATRLVPIIERLLARDVRVVLGADHGPLEFLKGRFPMCEAIKIPGYSPQYNKRGSLVLKVALDIPRMIIENHKAHDHLDKIIGELGIDAVISDNRYELSSHRIPTVFITHQLKILTHGIMSLGWPAVRMMMFNFISKHDEVWVPDFQGEPNLSGELSHVEKLPTEKVFYIGPLSRFQKLRGIPPSKEKPDVLCIMSGPEPQRTILENIFVEQAEQADYKTIILSGKPGKTSVIRKGNLEIRPHSGDEEMASLIQGAGVVISRSGYSTVMDMAALGKKAVFVPTPGQPEQEYLAERLKKRALYYSKDQKDFELNRVFNKAKYYQGLSIQNDYSVLDQRLDALLEKIH